MGGTYNLILNTVSKKIASFVAVISFLSYLATSIISAFAAIVYLAEIWPDVDIRLWSVIIMIVFGAIAIFGVKDSSYVTTVLFVVHMSTLTLLIVWSLVYGIYHDQFQLFKENLQTPVPEIRSTTGVLLGTRNVAAAIYFGYSAGLLGITGFEDAANYVEEMKDTRVFANTVDWMW
jgi:amino acid transporter